MTGDYRITGMEPRASVRSRFSGSRPLWFAFVLPLVASCSSRSEPAPPPISRHLLIVTIDTLRADRLGCYGNANVATPNMDRLAREGALATDATVHVPLTRPSHTSLFTGLYPADHGIRDNVSAPLSEKVPIMAELLRDAGFTTAAFVSSVVLSAQSGLNRGFATYGDRFEIGEDDARFLNTIQKRGDETTGDAVAWMRSNAGKRMALWVHLYDPHDPYEPPEPYAARYAGRLYDGEVAWSDDLIGRLDAALQALGIRDQTLTIVTSDHGEGLGEHGETVHGFFVYETTLKVPLIARGPGIPAGLRIGQTARTVDLLPTILDLLRVPMPTGLRLPGRSLAAPFEGRERASDVPTYAESLVPLLHFGWSDLRMMRNGRWKYILAPGSELYDLHDDPNEQNNLLNSRAARAAELRATLDEHLRNERRDGKNRPDRAGVPADLLEKLGALGYVSPGGPAPGSSAAGADPKDKIGEYKVLNRLMREGLTKLREKDYRASASRFESLRAKGIDSFEVHYYLGRALFNLDRARDAAPHFERAIERLPAYAPAYLALADCRILQRDLKGAVAVLRKGRAASPKDASLHEREAEVWRKLRNPDEAIAVYTAMLPLVPTNALVRVRLGELYRDRGQPEQAVPLLREAVKLDPSVASYWNSLGMVLGGADDFRGAEAAFREAATRDPSDPQHTYNLGLALLRQGRAPEAADYFRKTLQLEPGFRAARERLAETKARY